MIFKITWIQKNWKVTTKNTLFRKEMEQKKKIKWKKFILQIIKIY